MKRLLTLAGVLVALAAAGCAGSSTPSTQSSTSVTPVKTTQATYFNMATLTRDVSSTWNTSAEKVLPGTSVHGVTCIRTGSLTAECQGTYGGGGALDGQNDNVIVNISPDGQTFITHRQ